MLQPNLVLISSGAFPTLFSFTGDPVATDPNRTYLNQLTILKLPSDLDRATIFCGTATDRQQAQFFLRVYSQSATFFHAIIT